MSEQHPVRGDLPPSFPPAPAPPPAVPRTTSHPLVDDSAQVGFLILTKVAEGYEGRCYRPPTGLKPGVLATIPLTDMEPLWAALYDENGTCIRVLDG